MNTPNFLTRILLSITFIFTWTPGLVVAHGDDIHADPGFAGDHFTVYGQSEKYEMTLYYPELIAGRETNMRLFIADFHNNRPIDQADLKIHAASGGGNSPISFGFHALSPGIYEVTGIFPENKTYTLTLQVDHPNGPDLIGLAGIEVGKKLPVSEATAPASPAPGGHWLWFAGGILLGALGVWLLTRRRNRVLTALFLLGSAWFSTPNWNPVFAHGEDQHGPKTGEGGFGKSVYAPKETQFLFEILTHPVAVGDYQSATTMFGSIVPSSGGLGAVTAPQNGRIVRVAATVGQTVHAGQTLAVLQQNIGTSDQVGIAANNSGLALQIETAKVRLAATKKEFERLRKIEDIAAGKDLQAAEANYNQALIELQTLENRAAADNTAANNRTVAMVAPISGVVAAFTLAPGTEVVAGQVLFTVTNLNKVYVEAQVYDRDVPVVQAGNKFLVTCSTDDHKSAEVRLISQAQTMNPDNQSQRVLFEMDNPKGEFKIGEFVIVKALNQQSRRHISVPNTALTEINGKTAVFFKRGPEEFELAYVQTGEDDGTRTLILGGIEEGVKVVANGTYEVKMMYLSL